MITITCYHCGSKLEGAGFESLYGFEVVAPITLTIQCVTGDSFFEPIKRWRFCSKECLGICLPRINQPENPQKSA